MTHPEINPSKFKMHASDERSYKEEINLWHQCMRGGIITCETPGKAVALRHRMYRVRKKMQGSAGETPFDMLIIRLERGDTKLSIEKRKAGVVQVDPANPSDEEWGIAPDPRNSAEAIEERMRAAGLLKPRKPLINEE